jgi:cytochrome c oxidase assembly protein subunit 15
LPEEWKEKIVNGGELSRKVAQLAQELMATKTNEIPALALDGSSGRHPHRALRAFAWGTLAYNVAVILWGAYVRFTGSGAGCGNRWPLCDGVISHPQIQTVIEFTHRMSSGAALVSVACLWLWTRLAMPRKHPSRYAGTVALLLMINEALLGAFLVLFEHVAQDKSIARTISLSLHSVNTMLLLGAIAVTAFWVGQSSLKALDWPATGRAVILALIMLLAGATGAVTALADTLFPAASLGSSLAQDFSSKSHYLLRLRVLHPAVAVIAAALMAWLLAGIWRSADKSLRSLAAVVGLVFLFQLALGVLNVVLLAPMWLQILHLLTADILWITLVLLATKWLSAHGANEPVITSRLTQADQ